MNQPRHNRFFWTLFESQGLASPEAAKTREPRIYVYPRGGGERWKHDGSKAPPSGARSGCGDPRGQRDEDRARDMSGLHSAFRERETFYHDAPSLRQFAAHTKRGPWLNSKIRAASEQGEAPPFRSFVRSIAILWSSLSGSSCEIFWNVCVFLFVVVVPIKNFLLLLFFE